jgi:hypothetical protein
VTEILEAHYNECIQNDLTPIAFDDARRLLETLMMEIFGVSKSNSIKRPRKTCADLLINAGSQQSDSVDLAVLRNARDIWRHYFFTWVNL